MNQTASSMQKVMYQIADELRAIAALGLRYSESGYDHERYEQILKLSARLVSAIENGSDGALEEIYSQYTDNLAHVSPLPTVEAAVFRSGKILLIQRSDDQLWAMPGGLVEVGETLVQAVERELWEEAGVRGKAVQLLGIYDSRFWPVRSRMQLYINQFLLETEDIPTLHPGVEGAVSPLAEALDVGFFEEDHLPSLHIGHNLRVPMAFKLMRGEVRAPFLDR
jgi:8-oxo-dGTP pyrophosphatase MutT (NUDIX family)